MSTLFFWDIDHGKLARLPFLKSLLIICISLLCAFLPVLYLSPPSMNTSKLTSVASIVAVGLRSWALLFYASLVAPPLIFSFFNLMAKRIRDIGFYGWWFQFVIILHFIILANIHILLAVSMIPIYILFVFFDTLQLLKNHFLTYPPITRQKLAKYSLLCSISMFLRL